MPNRKLDHYLFSAFFRKALFLLCLFLLSLEDIRFRRIPNRCILVLILGWFFYTPPDPGFFLRRILSAFLISSFVFSVSSVFRVISRRRGLGAGDSKLIFALVLYLGASKGLYLILLACVLFPAFLLFQRKNRDRTYPFGPFLSLAAAAVSLF